MNGAPRNIIKRLFGRDRALIGMVHVRALPGAPSSQHTVSEVAAIAASEARSLVDCGFDGVLVENMHDIPYLRARVGPETVAAMTQVCATIRHALPEAPMGVQILAGANCEAMAVAHAVGAQFIRAENFVFSHVADEGLMAEASAGPLLRYRKSIGAHSVAVFADIRKKHAAHALTADLSMRQWASAAEFSGASAVIVTGDATGEATNLDDLEEAANGAALPVIAGSGVNAQSLPAILRVADCVIVGSAIKEQGHWANDIDMKAAKEIVASVAAIR